MIPLSDLTDQDTTSLIFYYSKLPIDQIEVSISKLLDLWSN